MSFLALDFHPTTYDPPNHSGGYPTESNQEVYSAVCNVITQIVVSRFTINIDMQKLHVHIISEDSPFPLSDQIGPLNSVVKYNLSIQSKRIVTNVLLVSMLN